MVSFDTILLEVSRSDIPGKHDVQLLIRSSSGLRDSEIAPHKGDSSEPPKEESDLSSDVCLIRIEHIRTHSGQQKFKQRARRSHCHCHGYRNYCLDRGGHGDCLRADLGGADLANDDEAHCERGFTISLLTSQLGAHLLTWSNTPVIAEIPN